MSNEADTCRKYVTPKLVATGWDDDPHSFTEQRTFTDGRIVPIGNRVFRKPGKRADYLLRYTRDFLIAVVEAKPDYKNPGEPGAYAIDSPLLHQLISNKNLADNLCGVIQS